MSWKKKVFFKFMIVEISTRFLSRKQPFKKRLFKKQPFKKQYFWTAVFWTAVFIFRKAISVLNDRFKKLKCIFSRENLPIYDFSNNVVLRLCHAVQSGVAVAESQTTFLKISRKMFLSWKKKTFFYLWSSRFRHQKKFLLGQNQLVNFWPK